MTDSYPSAMLTSDNLAVRRINHQRAEDSSNSAARSTSPSPLLTHFIILKIGWNFNDRSRRTRIPAAYRNHNFHSWITVTLNDGHDSVVQCDSLMTSSEYFFRCLNGNWQEISTGKVVLDFDMASWHIFRSWLETGFATSWPPVEQGMMLSGFNNSIFGLRTKAYGSLDLNDYMTSISRLIHAWILGDYLIAPHFQNDVINELTCAYENYWQRSKSLPWSNMQMICNNTLPNTPLREVVLDLIQFGLSKELIQLDGNLMYFMEENSLAMSPELANGLDIVHGIIRPAPWNRCRTFYHVYSRGSSYDASR